MGAGHGDGHGDWLWWASVHAGSHDSPAQWLPRPNPPPALALSAGLWLRTWQREHLLIRQATPDAGWYGGSTRPHAARALSWALGAFWAAQALATHREAGGAGGRAGGGAVGGAGGRGGAEAELVAKLLARSCVLAQGLAPLDAWPTPPSEAARLAASLAASEPPEPEPCPLCSALVELSPKLAWGRSRCAAGHALDRCLRTLRLTARPLFRCGACGGVTSDCAGLPWVDATARRLGLPLRTCLLCRVPCLSLHSPIME